MSQPRVTVTVGEGGQRSATISSSASYPDHKTGLIAGRKRSVKDRLGGASTNTLHDSHSMGIKRPHMEIGQKQRVYREEEDDFTVPAISHRYAEVQNPRQDLRYKLDQKISCKTKQITSGSTNMGNDLCERISCPPPPMPGQRIVVRRHPSLPSKALSLLGSLPPSTAIASRMKAVQKVSVAIEQPTVASLLQSLGLGKYSITFQAEEIDMTALRNMNDDDLKELGLPMHTGIILLMLCGTQEEDTHSSVVAKIVHQFAKPLGRCALCFQSCRFCGNGQGNSFNEGAHVPHLYSVHLMAELQNIYTIYLPPI